MKTLFPLQKRNDGTIECVYCGRVYDAKQDKLSETDQCPVADCPSNAKEFDVPVEGGVS